MITKRTFAFVFLMAVISAPLLTALRAAAERNSVKGKVATRADTPPFDERSGGQLPFHAQRQHLAVTRRGTGDLVQHDVSTQDVCEEVTATSQRDHRWHQGLSLNVDREILGGEVVAYQIQWSSGTWSQWFIPGVNDIDIKVNQGRHDTMRRRWSYFYDHTHRYLIVRPQSAQPTSGKSTS